MLYDRGYNAFWLYAYHQDLGRKFCMRARVDRDNLARTFVASGKEEAFVTYTPNRNSRHQCDEMNLSDAPITLRLIRVDLPNETEVLITNLMDEKRFPASDFKRLYHLRWGVEEFFKPEIPPRGRKHLRQVGASGSAGFSCQNTGGQPYRRTGIGRE